MNKERAKISEKPTSRERAMGSEKPTGSERAGGLPGLAAPWGKAKGRDMKVTRLSSMKMIKLAGEEGFEPSLTGPEPAVLPLDDSPVTDGEMCISPIVQSKFRPPAGLLNTTGPLEYVFHPPQKSSGNSAADPESAAQFPQHPIISPRPADINAPACRCGRPRFFSIWPAIFYLFRHGSLVVAFFPFVALYLGSRGQPCLSLSEGHDGGREVILC